ncbi:orotidine-5'-phosphate decarboxylase [Salisediminibacterium beveridgei]|uniref:Orotidine 5'-phosphate decarboxylase n=1 Tax=Salisediminibacterium beveridgei TaxID=632773 RepID=A0A1D7QW58_9BACI|nr:orotidine-5'-phosphate decarboxylase [Salisediminibacterium beveridgei]AOM83250.1 Orotidine 5'-phosphate decarboxylase [Salisediminibacterium beveridgei]
MRSTPLFIALDVPTKQDAMGLLHHFSDEKPAVKVGMELFYKEGPAMIYDLKVLGHEVFLDLKLHDIPETVKRSMMVLATLGIDLVNVHAAGGKRMMEAAMEGLVIGTPSGRDVPDCIAVTQLTSTSDMMLKEELHVYEPITDHVVHQGGLALQAGLKGVVCSAMEAAELKRHHPAIWTLTPGIRLKNDAPHDQIRVMTPSAARVAGSDAIVVGRGITKAENPRAAYLNYMKEWTVNDNDNAR